MKRVKSTLQYWYVLLTHCCAVLFAGKVGGSNGLLLLRLDALGDFILWLDSAKEYRKIYPGRKITLLVNAAWVESGRKAKADNTLTLMFKAKKLKRVKLKEGRGSNYTVA